MDAPSDTAPALAGGGPFTTPAVIVQPLTGYLLMRLMGFGLHTPWLQAAIALYLWLVMRLRGARRPRQLLTS